MAKERLFTTETSQDDAIADALASREREIDDYELNIAGYMRQLASADLKALPADWPAHLLQYKGQRSDFLANNLSGDNLKLAADLAHRDHVRMLLETTKIECRKSQVSYDALRDHLPPQRLTQAVNRKKLRDQPKPNGE